MRNDEDVLGTNDVLTAPLLPVPVGALCALCALRDDVLGTNDDVLDSNAVRPLLPVLTVARGDAHISQTDRVLELS